MNRPLKFIPAGLVLCIGSLSFAHEAVYRHSAVDCDRRLLENARDGGSVVLYTALAPTESGPLGQHTCVPTVIDTASAASARLGYHRRPNGE